MEFIKENPVAALFVGLGLLVLVVVLAGPIVSFVKFVLIVIGGLTVAKWVFEALSDE